MLVVYAVGPVPSLQEMFEHLSEVGSNWFKFGMALGLSIRYLRSTESSGIEVKSCLKSVLREWLRITPGACWQQVIAALEELDLTNLASRIKQKYLPEGVCALCVCVSGS